MLRVPNRIVNSAIAAATQKAVSVSKSTAEVTPAALLTTSKLAVTALSCSAM